MRPGPLVHRSVIGPRSCPQFGRRAVFHHRYRLADVGHQVELTDLIEVDILELPKLTPMDEPTLLWKWLRFLSVRDEEELDMAATLDPVIGAAVTKAKLFSADETVRILEEQREKARNDYLSSLNSARIDGLIEGRTEGRAEGLEAGARQKQVELAEALLARGFARKDVADLTQLSVEDVAGLE